MTDLPIRPVLQHVDLMDSIRYETGVRWTLGPTWYEQHGHSPELIDEFRPYLSGLRFVPDSKTLPNPEPSEIPGEVKVWAAQLIAKTTDYRVFGWNGPVPALERVDHTMEFWTMAGVRASYLVSGPLVPLIIHDLGDPNEVIVIPRPELPGTTTYIPVRAIATVHHVVSRTKVTNA